MARLFVDDLAPVSADVGLTLLEACDLGGVDLPTECGGFAACNSCRVTVHAGQELLSPLDPLEEPFLDDPAQRLGCQARIVGDGVVRVTRSPGA